MSIYSDNLRRLFSNAHTKRNEGLSEPEGIRIFRDIQYGIRGDNREWQLLDVYTPDDKKTGLSEKLPVMINVHGGAWVEGDKEEYRFFCMSLVRDRYAVINFSYRLAPEYRFPASIEDLNAVVHWVTENGDKYGFDPDNVYAIGDSSGGHMLALYAAWLTDPSFDDLITEDRPEGFSFRAIGINCSNVFFERENMNTTERHINEALFGTDGLEAIKGLPDPAGHITDAFPPVYMIAANKDMATKNMIVYNELLCRNGVDSECRVYGDDEKPLGHVFFLDIRTEASKEAIDDEMDYFEKHKSKNGESR